MAFVLQNTSVELTVKAVQKNTADLITKLPPLNKKYLKQYTTSTATKLWTDNRTVATTESLNLVGTLVDHYGQTLTFATVKEIVVVNQSASATLTVGGGTTPLLA